MNTISCKASSITIGKIWALALLLVSLLASTAAFSHVPQAWAETELTASDVSEHGDLSIQQDEDYTFENGALKISIAEGVVSYDQATKTLTLENVKSYSPGIRIYGLENLTVNLVGVNAVCDDKTFLYDYGLDDSSYTPCNVTITGAGSSSGNLCCGGNLTIESGTVNGRITCEGAFTQTGGASSGAISCNNLTMAGGTASGIVTCKDTFVLTDGKITMWSGLNSSYALDCNSIEVKGGTLSNPDSLSRCSKSFLLENGTVEDDVKCDGVFTQTGGSANKTITCCDFTMTGGSARSVWCTGELNLNGGTITGGLGCVKSNVMAGGTVKDGLHCDGSFTVEDGTVSGTIKCGGTFTQKGGKVSATDKASATGERRALECGGIAIVGGTFFADGNASTTENFVLKTGTVSGAVRCDGAFTQTGGTVGSDIKCTDFTMTGGTAPHVRCKGTLNLKGGTLYGCLHCEQSNVMAGGTVWDGLTADGNFTVNAGTIHGTVKCSGALTQTGGTIDGLVKCPDFTMTGGTAKDVQCNGKLDLRRGTLSGRLRCEKSNTMAGGTVKGGLACKADFTMKAGTIQGTISCSGTFTQLGGKVSVKASERAIICGNAVISKGTFSAKGDILCYKNFAMRTGSITGSILCSNLTMKGGKIAGAVQCQNLKMTGGTISKSKGQYAVKCAKTFTMSGGTIKAVNTDEGLSLGGYHTNTSYRTYRSVIAGGKISITGSSNCGISLQQSDLVIKGGTVKVTRSYGTDIKVASVSYRGKSYGGNITMTGGRVISNLNCSGNFILKGGYATSEVACSGKAAVRGGTLGGSVTCSKGFLMSKGKFVSRSKDFGVKTSGNVVISGGAFSAFSPSYAGIYASGGSVTISGGKVKVLKSYGVGIKARSVTKRGKTSGGKVVIKGGKAYLTVREPGKRSAILSDSLSGKASCLKTVSGRLPKATNLK